MQPNDSLATRYKELFEVQIFQEENEVTLSPTAARKQTVSLQNSDLAEAYPTEVDLPMSDRQLAQQCFNGWLKFTA